MKLFDSGLGYSALSTARSAVSSITVRQDSHSGSIGEHHLVKRFMRAVFQLRPALPRYNVTWDSNVVLRYLSKLYPLARLSLQNLSK